MNPDRDQNDLDEATSQRLRRLASTPVDTSRLDKWMQAQFGPNDGEATRRVAWFRWRSALGVAAAVAIAVLIGVMSLSGTRAVAAPLELRQVHEQVIDGSLPALAAIDLADAKRRIEALVDGAPRPDGDYPGSVRCCCGQVLAGERLAFVKTRFGQTPVTIVLMRGYHACAGNEHEMTDEQGRRFIVHHDRAGVQATLTPREDHWVCVMAALPTDDLLKVAGQIVF